MRSMGIELFIAVSVALSFSTTASAGEMIVYPAKGQSAEQTTKDKTECRTWATGQTGFDPVNPPAPPVAAAPPTTAPDGRRARGAARGAAVGGVAGAIGDDAGKGAAAGAAAGAMVAGMRRRDEVRAAQAQNDAALKAHQETVANLRAGWDRAVAACLTGRGYTVN